MNVVGNLTKIKTFDVLFTQKNLSPSSAFCSFVKKHFLVHQMTESLSLEIDRKFQEKLFIYPSSYVSKINDLLAHYKR